VTGDASARANLSSDSGLSPAVPLRTYTEKQTVPFEATKVSSEATVVFRVDRILARSLKRASTRRVTTFLPQWTTRVSS